MRMILCELVCYRIAYRSRGRCSLLGRVLSSNVFVSASNDSTIRFWDIDAVACLQKYTSLACEYIFGCVLTLLVASMVRLRFSAYVKRFY